MKQAIIITTCKEYRPWLYNLLQTLDTTYPIVIVHNTKEKNRYDILGIITGIELGFDEFMVLHDTVEIKNNDFFRIVFEEHKGKTVFLNNIGQMFLNKYTKEDLAKVDISSLYTVHDKTSGVHVERIFNMNLKNVVQPLILFQGFDDNDKREEKFGRLNMVIENDYLKKYKGSWDGSSLARAKTYIPK